VRLLGEVIEERAASAPGGRAEGLPEDQVREP